MATPQLFEPVKLRNLTLRNRSVVSPMCQYSAVDGQATAWHTMHLGQLACSGVGLIIIEATGVEPAGRISPGCLGLYDEQCEAALGAALRHCRQHSKAALGIQLAHAGRKASTKPPWGEDAGGAIAPSEPSGWEVVAPDTEPNWRPNSATPTALDEAGMERIIACWVDATERANRIGLDVIEIHCAHGYLLPSFLAGSKRNDQYAGPSIATRARFPLRVFEAVRAVWPAEKPLGVRFAVGDCGSVAEACAFAEMLVARGCDFVDLSGGTAKNASEPTANTAAAQSNAGAIRRHLAQLPGADSKPPCLVMTVSGIREPQQAEALLQDGEADLIGKNTQHFPAPPPPPF